MSGGGKGGSSTTQVQIPAWLESAAQSNLARADRLAQLGYTPYYGPDVAAMTPMQIAAMQGTNQAAAAFGMPSVDAMAGMPAPQTFAGGVQGYSSAPLYEQSLAALAASRPGQFAALNAPFIDPMTGAQPGSPFGAGAAPVMPVIGPQSGQGGMIISGPGGGAEERRNAMRQGGSVPQSGTGTGSFGLPDPMSGGFAGTNFPGAAGGAVNAVTRSAAGGGGSGGMGGGK